MARSKYYGYTVVGCPATHRWTLSEIPLSTTSVYNTRTTENVLPGTQVPILHEVINQAGVFHAGNTLGLPGGFYRVTWSATLATEAPTGIEVDLKSTGEVFKSTGATVSISGAIQPVTLERTVFLTVPPMGATIELINAGEAEVVLGGDLQVSVTRIL